ncbi:uncharacterized protein LOC108738697 [Agrilus planipennis]|uniref:Uncharacterized protein LOC108738697 n=1 Tax=Agrilus planipennis TaxID=224129 RepID=A0A7F5QZP6_AGRPL|nr:uncharacterized protein LOC108738697 [Agrilus planipennis]
MATFVTNAIFRRCAELLAMSLLLLLLVSAEEEFYSNTYISPKSALVDGEFPGRKLDVTYGPSAIESSKAVNNDEIITKLSETNAVNSENGFQKPADSEIVILKTNGLDDLLTSKNFVNLDSNEVELSGRRAYIEPSRTIIGEVNKKVVETKEQEMSGEGQGAPQARSLTLSEPQKIQPFATKTAEVFATQSYKPYDKARQMSPDIKEIITGLVKLLNGNVNVQANTAPGLGRPIRPVSTRINNRGPPRISDVPALPPNFDIPTSQLPEPLYDQMPPPVTSSKPITPYPFDVPPYKTSPVRPVNKRPSYIGPISHPSWTHSSQRRPTPPRRPKPPYKPIPLFSAERNSSFTSDFPDEDVFTFNLSDELQPSSEEDSDTINKNTEPLLSEDASNKPITVNNVVETVSTPKEDPIILNYEKNKEKSSSKMDKNTVKAFPTTVKNTATEMEATTSSLLLLNGTGIVPTQTVANIEPTKTNATLLDTDNVTSALNISQVTVVSITRLESSIQEVPQKITETTFSTPPIASLDSSTLSIANITPIVQSTSNIKVSESQSSATTGFSYFPYRPRPGIVLDDTEFKRDGQYRPSVITTRPPVGQLGDIFDITVSAIQGPGGSASAGHGKPFIIPVELDHAQNGDVITSPVGDEGFVSIDGKRTYLNLFGESTSTQTRTPQISPSTPTTVAVTGTGFAVPDENAKPVKTPHPSSSKPPPRRPPFGRRPNQPTIRIDTCIVGDDSTCDGSQHEMCKTESGVSACHCRPGHARRKHRDPCRKVVQMLLSLRVDRLYERRIVWANELANRESDSYLQLSYETEKAMDSAMSMTPFSDVFLGAKVNSIYRGDRTLGQAGVFVNLTIQLEESVETSRPTVRADIQRHLLGVIQRRSNNIGNSALWVDSPPGAVSSLQDLDECSSPELHDCHVSAKCINVFGGFKCECAEGYKDPWADNKHRAGRTCEQCSPQHCNNRGECKYQNGQEVCVCSGNYYGSQCEVDGEILGVAIGASVAAVIIIGLTLVCLVMWSRRWNKEHKAAVTSPVFGYMGTAGSTVKTPVVGGPPYQVTMEDRIRWAQIADVMAQSNHYAPEPGTVPTRPSSALFGYPNLSMAGSIQRSIQGTLPPVPMPRLGIQAQLANRAASLQGMRPLDNCSSSDDDDKADLERNFQVPRPKSRSNASIANQSGIYYDVDYEPNDIYKQGGGNGIPMSTYTIGSRAPYYRT